MVSVPPTPQRLPLAIRDATLCQVVGTQLDGDFVARGDPNVSNTIAANYFYNNVNGIEIAQSSNNIVIQNICAQNHNNGIYLSGIDTYPSQNNIIAQNQICRNGPGEFGHGNGIYGRGIGTSLGVAYNSIHYNLIYENANHGIYLLGDHQGNSLCNNTIYSNFSDGVRFENTALNLGWTIRNNIFCFNNGLELNGTNPVSMVHENNCYYRSGGNTVYFNGSYYSVSTVKTGFEPSAIAENPRFMDSALKNFRLRADSPCRDTGLDVGLVLDYANNSVPRGDGVDIGAWEYLPPTQMERLTWVSALSQPFYVDSQNNIVGQILCQAAGDDILLSLTIQNQGTALSNTDISALHLERYQPSSGQTQTIGAFNVLDSKNWRITLSQQLNDNDILTLRTDISSSSQVGHTCQFALPPGAAVFARSLPLESSELKSSTIQRIRKRQELILDVQPQGPINVLEGQTNIGMGYLNIYNASGETKTISDILFYIKNKEDNSIAWNTVLDRVELKSDTKTLAVQYPPFSESGLFSFVTNEDLLDQQIMRIQLIVDVSANPGQDCFRIELPHNYSINSGQLTCDPVAGKYFPLQFNQLNIRPPDFISMFRQFPNPFVASQAPMRISYYLEHAGRVKLEVFDLYGKQVKLIKCANQAAGNYEVTWEGKTNSGHKAKSGVYLLRIQAVYHDGRHEELIRKIALVR